MSLFQSFHISLTAQSTIPGGAPVSYVAGGGAALAGTASVAIGIALLYSGRDSYAAGSQVGVQVKNLPAVVIAGATIADGDLLYLAGNGQVTNVNPNAQAPYAIATQAGVAGDLISALIL